MAGPLSPIADRLAATATTNPGARALRGIATGAGLSHGALADFVDTTAARLRSCGIGRGDIVVLALPDGPEAFAALLAVASVATAFPVAPMEGEAFYSRLLGELDIRAVLMGDRPDAALTGLAAERGWSLIKAHGQGRAGEFRLEAERPGAPRTDAAPVAEDDALLVATAGSTGTPKIVALSQASLLRNAAAFAAWNRFTPRERSLCVMPIAHLHSIIRSSLPILLAGGEVVWAPGFRSRDLPDWIDATAPTYMSGTPTVFRGLVEEAEARGWRPAAGALDLVAIGSDKVDPALVRRTSERLACKAAEFYGMSEVSPLIAMTPRDGEAPAGAAGRILPDWDVAILDAAGDRLSHGAVGEVAVRGGTVNRVVGSDGAHRMADGFFRTGDLGRLDADGFLYIEGRADDRISRGGEKIAPAAVETALAAHPEVAETVAFGLPDPVLGQRVAALVALRHAARADAATLAAFAADRLPRTLAPERVILVDKIPRGRLGKVSRRALAEIYGKKPDAAKPPSPAPASASDAALLEIFRRHLKNESLGPDDSFFDHGDSLTALELLMEVETRFGVSLSPGIFLRHGSSSALADFIRKRTGRRSGVELIEVRAGAARAPLLLMPNVTGRAEFVRQLAVHLGPDRPVVTFHAPEIDFGSAANRDLTAFGAEIAELAMAHRSEGAFGLAGYSFGAHVALAAAHHLRTAGRHVSFVGVLDDEADIHQRNFAIARTAPKPRAISLYYEWWLNCTAARPYPGRIVYFRASAPNPFCRSDPTGGWGEIAMGEFKTVVVEGSHTSLSQEAGLAILGAALQAAVDEEEEGPRGEDALVLDEERRLRYEARLAARRGDRKGELDAYEAVFAINPGQPFWACGNYAEALIDAGRRPEGMAMYRTALARDPWPLTTAARFTRRLVRLSCAEELHEAVTLASRVDPDDPQALFQSARVLMDAGKAEQAEACLRRAVDLDPTVTEVGLVLAEFLRRQTRPRDALRAVEQVLDVAPGLQYGVLLKMSLQLDIGDAAGALATAERFGRVWGADPRVALCRGRALALLGRAGEARAVLGEAARLAPDDAEIAQALVSISAES
ncbi:MAG: AMP-binding protein [Alphaproteobacteria bacterium]|nr:AMP-binding protein [Alphaproteobacteria bacterium]